MQANSKKKKKEGQDQSFGRGGRKPNASTILEYIDDTEYHRNESKFKVKRKYGRF